MIRDDDDDGYSYTKDNKHIDEKQGSDDERSYTSKKTDTQDEKTKMMIFRRLGLNHRVMMNRVYLNV
jgi:hypothetical protein